MSKTPKLSVTYTPSRLTKEFNEKVANLVKTMKASDIAEVLADRSSIVGAMTHVNHNNNS